MVLASCFSVGFSRRFVCVIVVIPVWFWETVCIAPFTPPLFFGSLFSFLICHSWSHPCGFYFPVCLFFSISISLLMLLSFLKIMALNSSSVKLPNCSTLISSLVEVSCSFIWLLFLCFTILAITVGFGAYQFFPVGISVLLFVAPSPGFR
uniref:Uncharacterized protein n=1 Tax=Molossus molossus TaxID=27622 RepID=A0A7J8J7N1_MOLMO|nr:hypothetical protein HJG59_009622 [Molossus molossus]